MDKYKITIGSKMFCEICGSQIIRNSSTQRYCLQCAKKKRQYDDKRYKRERKHYWVSIVPKCKYVSPEKIIQSYKSIGNESILITSLKLNISEYRVVKALSTANIIINDSQLQILELHQKGLSAKQISEKLHLSVKTIQKYLPRVRPEYNIENASKNALTLRKFRANHKQNENNEEMQNEI